MRFGGKGKWVLRTGNPQAIRAILIITCIAGLANAVLLGLINAVAERTALGEPIGLKPALLFLNAFAIYSDGATLVVTNEAIWTAEPASVLQVGNVQGARGQVTGVSPGSGEVTASFGGETATSSVVVEDGELSGIQIFPEMVQRT